MSFKIFSKIFFNSQVVVKSIQMTTSKVILRHQWVNVQTCVACGVVLVLGGRKHGHLMSDMRDKITATGHE